MALYTAPSTTDLIAKVRRALRDGDESVFQDEQVVDFLNEALSELSLIRPLETLVIINDEDGLNGINAEDPDATTVSDLDSVFSVELIGLADTTAEGTEQTLYIDDHGTQWRNGWDFVAGTILLPARMKEWLLDVWALDEPTHSVYVRGYRHRRRIDDPETDVLDLFSLPEEQATVKVAQRTGFEALLNDRALFQQWQTATNNTDVSPTQLGNMVQGVQAQWDKMRKHLTILRRQPMGEQ